MSTVTNTHSLAITDGRSAGDGPCSLPLASGCSSQARWRSLTLSWLTGKGSAAFRCSAGSFTSAIGISVWNGLLERFVHDIVLKPQLLRPA